jgi:hypothetical protein
MVPFLEIFYTATVSLFASYTPTSIALLEELVTISDWYQCQLTELTEEDILWYSLEPMKVKFLKYWREIPPSPSLVTVPVRHGKTRLARLRHIDTTRLVTVPIRHNTNKSTTRLRYNTLDTACLIRGMPPSIIFGHGTARHEKNKIIKDTTRYGMKARRARTQQSPARHEFRTLLTSQLMEFQINYLASIFTVLFFFLVYYCSN